MKKVIFLDRDGVINKAANEHEHIIKWENFQFIDGVFEAIRIFNEANFKVIVLTNQSCIARGTATVAEIESIHRNMIDELKKHDAKIECVLYCPHDDNQCNCRKPKIGLFLVAETFFKIDKNMSYMIGDRRSDIIAGRRYGVKTVSIGLNDFGADIKCKSLREAAKIITER